MECALSHRQLFDQDTNLRMVYSVSGWHAAQQGNDARRDRMSWPVVRRPVAETLEIALLACWSPSAFVVRLWKLATVTFAHPGCVGVHVVNNLSYSPESPGVTMMVDGTT